MEIIKLHKFPVEFSTLEIGQVFQVADAPSCYTYFVGDKGIVNLSTSEIYDKDYFNPTAPVIIYKASLTLS